MKTISSVLCIVCILLQDDIVINYAYVKVPIQTQKEVSGVLITSN